MDKLQIRPPRYHGDRHRGGVGIVEKVQQQPHHAARRALGKRVDQHHEGRVTRLRENLFQGHVVAIDQQQEGLDDLPPLVPGKAGDRLLQVGDHAVAEDLRITAAAVCPRRGQLAVQQLGQFQKRAAGQGSNLSRRAFQDANQAGDQVVLAEPEGRLAGVGRQLLVLAQQRVPQGLMDAALAVGDQILERVVQGVQATEDFPVADRVPPFDQRGQGGEANQPVWGVQRRNQHSDGRFIGRRRQALQGGLEPFAHTGLCFRQTIAHQSRIDRILTRTFGIMRQFLLIFPNLPDHGPWDGLIFSSACWTLNEPHPLAPAATPVSPGGHAGWTPRMGNGTYETYGTYGTYGTYATYGTYGS